MLNLSNLMLKDYEVIKENLLENLSNNFSSRKEKETIELVDGQVTLQLNHLLTNLIMLRPYFVFEREIKKEDIVDCSNFNADAFNTRMQQLKEIFYTKENKEKLNDALACIIEDSNYLTMTFNKLIGKTVDLYSIAKLASRNEEFNDLIHTEIEDEVTNFQEVEKYITDRHNRAIELVKEEGNEICFSNFLQCGEGLNGKQLKQYWISVGPKPSLSGSVYPVPVNANLLTGFRKPSDYYIDATGGRKAAIISSTEVKDSGYLARRFSLATVNTILSPSTDSCDTVNFLTLDLTNEDEQRSLDNIGRLNGRYAIVDGEEVQIFKKDAKKYLNKVINVYSPITCSCKDGICKKCYGHLSEINYDIHIGKLGVDILSSQLTQMLLSSKHLLDTKTENIKWNPTLLKVFRINSNMLYPIKEFKSNVSILLDSVDVDLEDFLYNNRNESSVFISKLTIRVDNGKKVTEKKIELDKKLLLSSDLINYIKTCAMDEENENYIINMADMSIENPMFYFTIDNNELSSHLYKLQDLIERKDHLGCETWNEIMHEICSILPKSGIKIDLVHIENLIRELIKNPVTRKRPNFSQVVNKEDYIIYTLDNSIIFHPSVVVGLAFERIASQIADPLTYTKNHESYLDDIFR